MPSNYTGMLPERDKRRREDDFVPSASMAPSRNNKSLSSDPAIKRLPMPPVSSKPDQGLYQLLNDPKKAVSRAAEFYGTTVRDAVQEQGDWMRDQRANRRADTDPQARSGGMPYVPIPGVVHQPETTGERVGRRMSRDLERVGAVGRKHGLPGVAGLVYGEGARTMEAGAVDAYKAGDQFVRGKANDFVAGVNAAGQQASPSKPRRSLTVITPPDITNPPDSDSVGTGDIRPVPNRYTEQRVLGRDTDADGKLDAFSDDANAATLRGGPPAALPNNGNPAIFGRSDGQRSEFVTTPASGQSIAELNATADQMRDSRLATNRGLIDRRAQRWAAGDQYRANSQAQEMFARAEKISKQLTADRMPRAKRATLQAEAEALRATGASLMRDGAAGKAQPAQGMTPYQAAQLGLQGAQFNQSERKFAFEQQQAAAQEARQQFDSMDSAGRARLEQFWGKDNIPDIMSFYVEERPRMENDLGIELPPNVSSANDNLLGEIYRRYQRLKAAQENYDNSSFITRPFKTRPTAGG